MTLEIPYVGPGADNAAGTIRPNYDQTLKEKIEALVNTPAGTSPASITPDATAAGLLCYDPNNNAIDVPGFIYHSVMDANTVGFYSFDDPNCFPLAGEATSTPAPIPVTTTLYDLHSITRGPGQYWNYSVLYPNNASSGTAVQLNMVKSSYDDRVGILFSDSNASGVAESICILPYVSGSPALAGWAVPGLQSYPPGSSQKAVWGIAFDTPAALSAGTDTSFFTIGSAIDGTLQCAFVLKAGQFGVYVNGNNYISLGTAPAVSTRYVMTIELEYDPFNELQWIATAKLYISGAANPVKATAYIPFSPSSTPWNYVYTADKLATGDSGATPVAGFGPVAAFGGQWSFLALGYIAADLTLDGTAVTSDVVKSFADFFGA